MQWLITWMLIESASKSRPATPFEPNGYEWILVIPFVLVFVLWVVVPVVLAMTGKMPPQEEEWWY